MAHQGRPVCCRGDQAHRHVPESRRRVAPVKQHGIHVADVRSVEQLAVYFDLADLEEALSAAA
jgi:hypothetical protein